MEMATFLSFVWWAFLHLSQTKQTTYTPPKGNTYRSNNHRVLFAVRKRKTKYLITYEIFKGLGIQQLSPWTWNDFTEDAFFSQEKEELGINQNHQQTMYRILKHYLHIWNNKNHHIWRLNAVTVAEVELQCCAAAELLVGENEMSHHVSFTSF